VKKPNLAPHLTGEPSFAKEKEEPKNERGGLVGTVLNQKKKNKGKGRGSGLVSECFLEKNRPVSMSRGAK